MALLCNAIDQLFCGLKPCCQFFNPCVKTCGCGNRKVFYNYDGSSSTEPLVSYFKPSNFLAKEKLVKGMQLDKDVLRKGLTAVEQIATVVNFAYKNQYSVRAVGAGHSWTNLTSVRDILIDMKDLDQIIDAKPQNSVSSIYHIEVQSGMVLNDFYREIDRRYGMGLPTTTSGTKQLTVGGIVSTSSHGTGAGFQTLSNFIVELHLIICRGIQVKVRLPRQDGDVDEGFESVQCRIQSAKYGNPPMEICSTEIFRAAAVGLGSLGVIYSVTFECIAVFNIKETRRTIDFKWPTKKQSKKFKIPSQVKEQLSDPTKYVTILVNPYPAESDKKPGQAVLKTSISLGERTGEDSEKTCRCQLCYIDCQCFKCCTYQPDCSCRLFEEDCILNGIYCFTNCFPSCIPTLADGGIPSEDHPNIDRWDKVIGYADVNTTWRQAEYFIPLCDMDRALEDVVRLMSEYLGYGVYTLFPLLVRIVKADDLYLSMASRRRCDGTTVDTYVAIDILFPLAAYGIDEFHKKLEDHLFDKYKGRPHWGKNNFLNLDSVDQLYPDLDKWKRVYLLFNSDGTFDNEFTGRVGFENFRGGASYRRNVLVRHTSDTAIHVSTISGQQVAVTSAQAQSVIAASADAQQTTAVTTEDQKHAKVASSKIIFVRDTSSNVITSQPKSSKDPR